MEREVFSDPEIAALMNRWFVNIKVDREERPDIDEIYMTVTQLLTGSGGWPNSVFLTPQLEPFFAGTYFPSADQGQRRGFPTVLRALHRAWESRQSEIAIAGGVSAANPGMRLTYQACNDRRCLPPVTIGLAVPEPVEAGDP